MHPYSMHMSPAPGPGSKGPRVQKNKPLTRVDANVLLGIPSLEQLDPARLQNQTMRQLPPDVTTAESEPKETLTVISDVMLLLFFKNSNHARSWSMNQRYVNVLTAPSLVYMQGVREVNCCHVMPPCCDVRRIWR